MSRAQISLLGQFTMSVDGKVLAIPSKAKELVTFLALQPNRRAQRRRISGILWPESSDDRALQNLNTLLWRLRKLVSPHLETYCVQSTRSTVGLYPDALTIDYWDFETCCERLKVDHVDLEVANHALSLYKGDLLEGELDSDWLLAERERIRRDYVRTLRLYARALTGDRRILEALRVFERVLAADPLDEEACREAMRLYQVVGKSTEAIRLYTSLANQLRFELGVSPESETEHLKEQITLARSTQESVSSAPGTFRVTSPSQIPLVGRSGEMSELRAVWLSACQGRLMVVGVEGEAGIGKTRLVGEFVRFVLEAGGKVFMSTCDEVSGARPYEALVKLFRGSRQSQAESRAVSEDELEHASSFGQIRPPGSANEGRQSSTLESEGRVKFFETLALWLRQQATEYPVLAIIEDLHFIDSASLDLLSYLKAELRDSPMMMILTWRQEESPQRVQNLVKSPDGFRAVLSLARLTKPESRRLCQELLGTPEVPSGLWELVHRESEGNPLFAIEILRLLAAEGTDHSSRLRGFASDSHELILTRLTRAELIPPGIRGVIRKRVARLPRKARQLLRFASACGRSLDLDLLEKATGVSQGELTRAVDALSSLGFIASLGGAYEFMHDKIRACCYDELGASIRRSVHRKILSVLENVYPDRLEELAFHSERSGGSAKARVYWERVGDRAGAVWAHRDAVVAYTRAYDNLKTLGASAWRRGAYGLLKKRASAWEALGRIEMGATDIGEMLQRASDTQDQFGTCEALAFQSRLLIRQGFYEQAGARAWESLGLAEALGDASLEARAREALAFSHYRSGKYDEAEQMLLELDPVLQRIGDNECRERVWNRIGSLQAGKGDIRALQSLEIAEKCWAGNLFERGARNLLKGLIFAHTGRRDEARLSIELAEVAFRRAGNRAAVASANSVLSLILACSGDLVAAVRYARKGLPFKSGQADRYWKVVSSTNICHGILLGLGNFRLAKRMTLRVLEQIPQLRGRAKGNLLDLSAVISLEEGDLESAQSLVFEALREIEADDGVSRGEFLSTLGRIVLAQGRVGEAAEILRSAVSILERGINYLELVQALSNLGLALRNVGREQEAISYSERALNLLASRNGFTYRPQEVFWNHFLIMRGLVEKEAERALASAYRIVIKRSAPLGVKMRARYLAVPRNRAIVETWGKVLGRGSSMQPPTLEGPASGAAKPLCVTVLIPRSGAPWGRPLRAEDLVDVILTIDAGRADERLEETDGEVGLRRARILRLCAEANVQGGDMREEDLARVLGVSTRTVRADIAYLRARGCHLQTRGAAMH